MLLANVTFILSGDDRQISSVGRGRQFKVFANHYYSSNIYNINRQSSKWGKFVAMTEVSLLGLGQRRESLDRCVRGDRVLMIEANKEQDSQVVKIV